jgi:molecular chaperone GrpE
MNEKPDESANFGGPAQVDSAAQANAGLGTPAGDQGAQQIIAELRAENSDLRDKVLRAMAEMENFRRRAEREKSDGMKYAVSEFARDAVTIGDNLRRAIEAVQKEAVENDPALKTLLEGVEVTERELIKVFERHGVTRFDPLGEKFDPHVHEAMVKVDVPNVPADIVVQVLQAGYKINDRVLRPAAVIVAKGGSTVAQPQQEWPNAESSLEAADGEDYEVRGESIHLKPAHDHDAGSVRETTSAPKSTQGQGGRKERPAGEKRTSTVTKPVTENSAPLKKDDLISSFGKRLENGN